MFGKPVSAVVGTFGSVASRVRVVTAYAFILPAWT